MQVTLTAWHEQHRCTWCDKEKEGVTATFSDGFLTDAPVCWSCLAKAVKVRSRQAKPPEPRSSKSPA